MSVCGRFVDDFANASHVLPEEMNMNADYPFMLPKIVSYDGKHVTVQGSAGAVASFPVRRCRRDGMYGWLKQKSSFEMMLGLPPQRFKMLPFKDDRTPSIAEQLAQK